MVYDFEDGSGTVAHDSSGSGNDATFTGATSWSTDTYGPNSKFSLNFTGTDYIVPARSPNLGESNFTIAEWIKTTSANGQMYTVANAGGCSGYRFGLGGGKIAFLIGGTGGCTETLCGTKSVNDGKWHNIVGSFSHTDLVFTCYIDGQVDGTVSIASYTAMVDIAPYIGKGLCCTAFAGQLDDVRIYAQNLSGVSVAALYNREKGRFGIVDGSVAHPIGLTLGEYDLYISDRQRVLSFVYT